MSKCRVRFPRLALIATVAVLTAEAACRDTPTAPTAHNVNVSPAVNTPGDSGAPEISFLAPLGPRRAPKGELDTTLAPTVTICRLNGDSCTSDTLAHFTSDQGATAEQRVRLTGKAYIATWDLSTISADTSAAYRIVVALGDTTVGYTDARVVPAGYRPPASDTARFAFLTPRHALNIQFQIFMPPELLTVFAEPGVHGSLVTGSAVHRHGERVSYQFEADSGYTNVLVTVDQEYLPRRGRITMNRAHVLVASADRDASVAYGDEWIVREGRALLRSARPVQAAQQFLDDIAATRDTTNLVARLARVERVLVQANPGALRSLDLALAGHSFYAGSGIGVAAPVVAPPPGSGGGIVADNLLPGPAAQPRLVPSRSVGIMTRSRYEPLTIAYVNGVLTSPYGALFNADAVARMARASTWSVAVPFEVRLIYNSTATSDGTDPNDRCVIELARNSQGLGINTLPQYVTECEKGTSPTTNTSDMLAKLADFAEAGIQLSNIITGLPLPHPADADSVAAITARWMAAGRHVVFVPHSQGNLMVQQGINILARKGLYHPATDTTCIGAVPLAAPTSANWPISSRHLTGIVAAHDAILALGSNHFPQVRTPLGDSADSQLGQWRRLSQVRGLAGALTIRWAVRIHELTGGYLNPEPIRTRIQEALVHSYKSCALGEITVTPQRMVLPTGASRTFSTTLLDLNADPLDGSRAVTWKGDSGDDLQRAVSVLPDGRVRALYVGGTAARASTSTVTSTVAVEVEPAPLPVVVAESLSARWTPISGTSASSVPGIPTGPPPTFLSERPAPWNGDNCMVRQEITLEQGQVSLVSKVCTAKYRVTAEPVTNATRYEATFFELNHTNRLFTLAASTPVLRGEISGPPDSLIGDLPGPTLLDRVNVTARDSAGHLLSSGSACAHGCAGWPGFP
ncbi:MAG: hypothetical protein ACR2MQ_11055 [Gemmatimonadaceae bacterium]